MKPAAHTPQQLRKILWYNPLSGIIKWKADAGPRALAGSIAGAMFNTGYVCVTVEGECYPAHRLAWALFKGRWPEGEIDHRDGDRANNAIANLRECSTAENAQNRAISKANKSGYVGVQWHEKQGGWLASITVNGKAKWLGVYATREAAAKRYAEEKRRLHKFHPEVVARVAV